MPAQAPAQAIGELVAVFARIQPWVINSRAEICLSLNRQAEQADSGPGKGVADVIELLVTYGADVNIEFEGGRSLLHYAVSNSDIVGICECQLPVATFPTRVNHHQVNQITEMKFAVNPSVMRCRLRQRSSGRRRSAYYGEPTFPIPTSR